MEKEREELIEQQKLSFFKVILPTAQASEELRIPPKFAKHIEKDVCKGATFRGPSGRCWPVKLCKNAKSIFVKDGWHQFFMAHGLGHSEFLLFTYDGNMCFDVRIYGKNGLERMYVHQNDNFQESISFENDSGNETESDSDSDEAYEVKTQQEATTVNRKINRAGYERGETSQSDQHQTNVKRKRGRPRKQPDPSIFTWEEVEKKEDVIHEMEKKKVDVIELSDEETDSRLQSFKDVKSKDISRSTFPFFEKYMDKASCDDIYRIKVPLEFAEKYMPKEKLVMTLRNEEGKSWEVNFIPNGNFYRFCRGWVAFARDNKLSRGDLCVFELVNKLEMQVYILR